MTSKVPAMFLPDNIFGNGFSNGVQDDVFSPPSSLSEVKMETNAPLFNKTFEDGMDLWTKNLPNPTIYDSNNEPGMDETAQSQNEIVQKVLIIPYNTSRKSFEQHDFFFIDNSQTNTMRAFYSSQNRYPYKALTLNDMQKDTSLNSYSIEELVKRFNPMGTIFNYVSFEEQKTSSKLIAYSLGGLCDILNLWHVTVIPGIILYFVAYKNNTNLSIVPYAGLTHPMIKSHQNDPMAKPSQKEYPWQSEKVTEVAIINVGTVCAGNNRQPLQLKGLPYLVDSKGFPVKNSMLFGTGEIDPTNPTCPQVCGNILRIRMSCLQWEYYNLSKTK